MFNGLVESKFFGVYFWVNSQLLFIDIWEYYSEEFDFYLVCLKYDMCIGVYYVLDYRSLFFGFY